MAKEKGTASSPVENEPSEKELKKKARKELRRIRSLAKKLGSPQDLKRFRIFLENPGLNIQTIVALEEIQALLNKENVSVVEFEHALELLESHQITFPNFVSLIDKSETLKQQYERPLTALVQECEEARERLEKLASELGAMEASRTKLEAKLLNLQNLERLNLLLAKDGVSVEAIVEHIERYHQLKELGFDFDIIEKMVSELRRLNIDPSEAGKEIALWFQKNRTLDQVLLEKTSNLEELKKKEALSNSQMKAFEEGALQARKKIDALEGDYAKRSQQLENEFKVKEKSLLEKLDQLANRYAEQEKAGPPSSLGKISLENETLKKEAEALRKEIELVKSLSLILRNLRSLNAKQLEALISQFSRDNEGAEAVAQGSPLENLIATRTALISTLKEWSLLFAPTRTN